MKFNCNFYSRKQPFHAIESQSPTFVPTATQTCESQESISHLFGSHKLTILFLRLINQALKKSSGHREWRDQEYQTQPRSSTPRQPQRPITAHLKFSLKALRNFSFMADNRPGRRRSYKFQVQLNELTGGNDGGDLSVSRGVPVAIRAGMEVGKGEA